MNSLALALLLPDRLPSLMVLVGFWIPPAIAGWVAAAVLQRSTWRYSTMMTGAALATFVLGYAAAWFAFNLRRMPPYIPGALPDPTVAPPEAVSALATVAGAFILPGSAIACVAALYLHLRILRRSAVA